MKIVTLDTKKSCLQLRTKVSLKGTLRANELDVRAVPGVTLVNNSYHVDDRYALQHPLILLQLQIILPIHIRESPLLRYDDLLATRELVPCATERFLDDVCVRVLAADGEDDLANVDAGDSAVRLAPSTAHTSLETK